MLLYNTINTEFKLTNKRRYTKWIKDVLNEHELSLGDINYVFTDDPTLLKYNIEFLGHDYFTDVITFDTTDYMSDEDGNTVSGDILISVDTVKSNAEDYGVSFEEELKRVMVHGVLHLIGYDDTTDELKMEMSSKEDLYLSKF